MMIYIWTDTGKTIVNKSQIYGVRKFDAKLQYNTHYLASYTGFTKEVNSLQCF